MSYPAMTEAHLQREVRRLVALYGLFEFHVPNSKGCRPGWPDLVIVGTRMIFRELKKAYENPSASQRDVGYKLQAAGADWSIWRPLDLESGLIARELEAIRPPWVVPPSS